MFRTPAAEEGKEITVVDTNHDYNTVSTQFFSFGKRKCSEAIPTNGIVGFKSFPKAD